jgi:RND family efflux transporter MFP subunit
VRDGEILGVLEAPEVEQQMVSKRADLAVKKLSDARYQLLVKSGLASQADLEQQQGNVNIAEADLRQLSSLSGYQVLRAPFAGVITARFADPGALLQAATATQSALALVSVADIDRARVQIFLAQNEATFVREGDKAVVWAEEKPDARAEASITRMAKELDPRTRTMLTEIEIDNTKTNFYPGSFVRVKLTLAASPALGVPSDAIFINAGKPTLCVVDGDHVRFVSIELLDSDGKSTRVRGAVKDGDGVVRHPSDDVLDGARVRIAPPIASAH